MTRKIRQYLPIFTLGLSTISTQVIFLRKFLDVFYGNELIIGILLTNWMLLTGLGAWISRKWQSKLIRYQSVSFILLSLLPMVTLAGIVAGRTWLFPSGSTLGLFPVLLFSLVLQFPYCLISGSLFPSLTSDLVNDTDFTLSRSYLAESLGSFVGVLIFNIVLLFLLPTFAILYLLFLLNLLQALGLKKVAMTRKTYPSYGTLLIGITAALLLLNPDKQLKDLFFKGQKVLESKESPYGNLVVTESSGQMNFYENGLPLFPSNDAISREESVHYAMLQHSFPKRVLLVSGGIGGQLEEVLKYPVDRVDYLEVNPWILKLGAGNGLIPGDPRVRIITADARLFLRSCTDQYDIVLLQLPDPVTAQVNRYFTHEFFRELLKNLTRDAVVSISLRSTADYMSPISRKINSLLYNSLIYSFKQVIIIPGSRNYFLASDADLTVNVASLAEKRGIKTSYVNSGYLQDDLLSRRSKEITARLEEAAGLNRDFQPRAYFEETRLWLSAFDTPWWIPCLALALLLVLYFRKINKPRVSLFVTGFTVSALSFLLMMAFQALFGYLYLMSGVLISLFMLGLALGCWLHPKLWKRGYAPSPAWIQIYLGVFVILFLMALLGNKSLTGSSQVLAGIFGILNLLNGLLTGLQFSAVATESEDTPGSTASAIYSADLLGSALGMLLVSAIFFPLAGLIWVCLGLGLINFVTGFVLFE